MFKLIFSLSLLCNPNIPIFVGIPTLTKAVIMSEVLLSEYEAKLDNKKRVTIRNAPFPFYKIKVYKNGKVVMEPRVLVDPNKISSDTLRIIDSSVKNFKKGKVSKPIDFSKY